MTSILILLAILGVGLLVSLVHDLRHGRVGSPPPPRYDWSSKAPSHPYKDAVLAGSARSNWLY